MTELCKFTLNLLGGYIQIPVSSDFISGMFEAVIILVLFQLGIVVVAIVRFKTSREIREKRRLY